MLELLTQSQINSPYGEVVVQNVAVPTSTATVRSRYGDAVLSENQAVDWIVPEGVFYISAVAIGAGGSGEGSNVTNAGSGGGAGGLAYISDYFVRPGDTLRIYVGAKGYNITDGAAGGRGDGASGIRHNGSVILLASTGGGGAALNAEGEGGGGIIGDGLFRGGDGNVGDANVGGYGGNAPGYYSDGVNGGSGGTTAAGGSGQSPYGYSGTGEYYGSNFGQTFNGGVGGNWGGGGGGAVDESSTGVDYDGGNGGEGIVRIIYGRGRRFPDTLTSEEYSQGNVTLIRLNSTI